MEIRAEIVDTGNPKKKAASIIVNAPITQIFNLLAKPAMHPIIDGSNSVKSVIEGPERLTLGDKFSMNMRIGIKYRITNKVVEFKDASQNEAVTDRFSL